MAMNFINTTESKAEEIIKAAPLQEKPAKTGKKEKRDIRISITIKESELKIIDDCCDRKGVTRSNLIRMGVLDYVERLKKL